MTLDIALTLSILLISLVLFITEKLSMDLVALLVLSALALTGLLSTEEALSGFSNPAVITVWAMFILSEGLTKAGVADYIGRKVLRLAGASEIQTIIVIMLSSGVLSAFMNNIGVAALMLPVVMDLARKTGRSPSRLLMPLAYGSLLGGLTTLIGTPPNLLVSAALRENGFEGLSLFDFTPVGAVVMLAGVAFVAFFGRKILREDNKEDIAHSESDRAVGSYLGLEEERAVLKVEDNSTLVGKTLAETRLGSAAGLSIVALMRSGGIEVAPAPDYKLQGGDRLVAQGQLDRFKALQNWSELLIDENSGDLRQLMSDKVSIFEYIVKTESDFIGKTIRELEFAARWQVNVLAIRQGDRVKRVDLASIELSAGDCILLQGSVESRKSMEELFGTDSFRDVEAERLEEQYRLQDRTFLLSIPDDSHLLGKTLKESRLGEAFGLRVLATIKDDQITLIPSAETVLEPQLILFVEGRHEYLKILKGLQELRQVDEAVPDLANWDPKQAIMAEATLAPRTSISNRSLRDLRFRDRYGLQVLAVWRAGKSYRSNLGDLKIQLGDALLLAGSPESIKLLEEDKDLLLLSNTKALNLIKPRYAVLASAIMLLTLLPVLLGHLPIAIAAVAGASLMVLTGCLSMQDAYRSIEWRSIFLIAGMLPLGLAMEKSGAATYLADLLLFQIGDYGAWPTLLCLYLITAMATTIIPTSALVVLMAPIAIQSAAELAMSPQAVMIAIAIAASASFTSPISHPANILVMGPGGYRFIDYIKVGSPLALIVFVTTMLTLPLFWSIF